MSENPIERLNYFNGQRLEADDLRLEQEYHIRIQRWLSKSLFSAGIADGLEVSAIEDPLTKKKNKVRVTPGLALDDLGRAIILVRSVELIPQARFLCVRYAEHKERVQEGQCVVRGAAPETVAHVAGPERIVSDAELTWRTAPPLHDTRELVIAELALNADCTVAGVLSGPRHFAVASQVSRVRSFALEGEKNIDQHNPKRVYFHIRGRRPEAVILYVRAESFSTLFYTELPRHDHDIDLSIPPQTVGVLAHTHSLTGVSTANDGVHDHLAFVSTREQPSMIATVPIITDPTGVVGATTTRTESLQQLVGLNARQDNVTRVPPASPPTLPPLIQASHAHGFAAGTKTGGVTDAGTSTVTLTFNQKTIRNRGLGPERPTDPDTNTTRRLRHFSNLQVAINDKPVTVAIIDQLANTDPRSWTPASRLDSDDGSPLRFDGPGAGPIRLDLLPGVTFDPGEHWIDFSVQGDRNGGCVHYNLYVE
jgi:hypothetical protein